MKTMLQDSEQPTHSSVIGTCTSSFTYPQKTIGTILPLSFKNISLPCDTIQQFILYLTIHLLPSPNQHYGRKSYRMTRDGLCSSTPTSPPPTCKSCVNPCKCTHPDPRQVPKGKHTDQVTRLSHYTGACVILFLSHRCGRLTRDP